jgi:hypothetical protein
VIRTLGVVVPVNDERDHLLAGASSKTHLWIANADDSAVPEHWLTTMLVAADGGAHVVLGTVLPGAGRDRPGVRCTGQTKDIRMCTARTLVSGPMSISGWAAGPR